MKIFRLLLKTRLVKKYLVLFGFVLLTSTIFSQSVESFIELAKQNNQGLKALKLEYEAAQFIAAQHSDYPDPKVSLGLGILPIETRLGAQRFKIGVSQSIPWKGQLKAKSSVAEANAEVKSNLDEVKEIDIEFAIRTAYSALVFLNDKEDILAQKLEVLDAMEEIAKSGVRSGNGKLSNVLFVERNRTFLLADIDLLEKQKEQSSIMINRWAGKTLMDSINILPQNNILLTIPAPSSHPQLLVLENQKMASDKIIELTKYESKPKIGVGLDYSWIDGRNGVDISHNGRDVLMPMGSISIPLSKGRFKAKRQEEKLRQEAIDAKMMDLKEMYHAEISTARSKIEYALMKFEKYESLKEITTETLGLMRSEFATEGTRFEELLRLEMDIIDYEIAIAQAQYEQNLAFAILHKYID